MNKTRPYFPTNWEEVCANPYLANLPYKVEINRFGKIELSPHNFWHTLAQGEIEHLLRQLMNGGKAFPECAIEAPNGGTPVADVCWASRERIVVNLGRVACQLAPEICVEVRSPGNTRGEMADKLEAYFGAGAGEVWFCGEDGVMQFHGPNAQLERSLLCPDFPARVEVKL